MTATSAHPPAEAFGRVDRSGSATRASLLRALLIAGGWIASIAAGLAWGHHFAPPAVVALALFITWLSTGVFILAHDAMHGTLVPSSRVWNDRIGAALLFLYAFFPWRRMVAEHRRHHAHAGTEQDPDFHAPGRPGVVAWYLRFVGGYLSWRPFVGFAILFNLLAHGVGIPQPSLFLFWIGPVVLSTFQLFVFGTWLPHREGNDAWPDAHRARSNALPSWLSLLTCFHFGYHWEHHQWPHLPWWRLPQAREAGVRAPSIERAP